MLKFLKSKFYHKPHKTGLVLSGGGARGLAHLGAVKALYEKGFKFDIIAGTSMGASIGVLLADGKHPDEIIEVMTPEVLKSFIHISVRKNSLMNMTGGMKVLEGLLQHKNIEELPTPFAAVATNLQKGEPVYFEKGDILQAINASASIPVIFPNVKIDGDQYIDGGVFNNLPARHIREQCKMVIGIHVNPKTLGYNDGHITSATEILIRSFHLAMLANVEPDKKLCDLVLEFDELGKYGVLEFSKMEEIVKIGYEGTLKALDEAEKKNN